MKLMDFLEIAEHYYGVIKNSEAFQRNAAETCTDPELLVPSFREKIDLLEEEAKKAGLSIKRTETFRTNALQLHYYRAGLSKIKLNGMHHYGIAQDILCVDEHGQPISRGDDKAYITLRGIADEIGLHLLGLWDAGHFQGVATSEQNALRNFIANHRKTGLVLKYGSENHYVASLKKALGALGYEVNTDTNFFGDATDEALKQFQSDKGLQCDGIAGPAVIKTLKELGYNLLD